MKKIIAAAALAAALTASGVVYAQANNDSVSTRAEAQAKAEEMFGRMDANRDGKIDGADREARHAAMFDKMDADKNGQVSRAEFMAMHTMRQGMRGAADAGGDHEMGEHRGGRHGMGVGGRGMRGGMLRMADADHDGTISRQEFVAGALTRFDRGDANRDGKLTAEERRAARTAMWGGRRGGGRADDAPLAMPPSDGSDDE